MQRSNILSAIASGLLVVCGGVTGIFSLVVGYLVGLFCKKHEPQYEYSVSDEPLPATKTVDSLVHLYGEPDDVILFNAARGNEADSVVLVYDSQGFFVVGGVKVRREEIVDVTFNNTANPYMANDYQVVIQTTLREHPSMHFMVGQDLSWAGEVVARLNSYL